MIGPASSSRFGRLKLGDVVEGGHSSTGDAGELVGWWEMKTRLKGVRKRYRRWVCQVAR